jgi:hypothetical protein
MDGLIMVAGVNIYDTSSTDIETIIDTLDPVVTLVTNEIPLTKDNYKYLITTNIAGRNTRTINISRVNMYDYNVNIVNKIQKNVINVSRPEDYKSNIIKPVFYRSSSVDDLTIHPAVLENIGVNLNQYKSKVDLFYIKVEGVEFMEIGRTSNSVLFAIDGSKLPNKVESGIYYILNQDFEMVTSGKYKYEQ